MLKLNDSIIRYLNENQLNSIPKQFFKSTNLLEWLFLDDNYLNYLDLTIFAPLQQLKWLELQHNFLTLIDQEFPSLENLTELQVPHTIKILVLF